MEDAIKREEFEEFKKDVGRGMGKVWEAIEKLQKSMNGIK